MNPSTAKWTFMVYMAGDNSLSNAGDIDLTEMRQVGSTADVNVVAEFDNAGNQGTRRFHIQPGGVNERVISIGETDSGNPQTLIDFVTWAATEYPAERYALVLWNHGGGWKPGEIDGIAREVGSPGYNTREATRSASRLRRSFFRTTIETIMRLSKTEREICCDEGSSHSLDTIELGRVLDAIVARLGQPLDLLGMDACLMSNLEVAYQVRHNVRYIVASEMEEPEDGWPYKQVLHSLVTKPTLPTSDFATRIVKAYIRSYVSGNVTQSAFDLAQIDTVTEPLNLLAEVLLSNMPRAKALMLLAQCKSAHFCNNTLWDIGHFCEELAKATGSKPIDHAIEGMQAMLKLAKNSFVLAEAHKGSYVSHCRGVSIYLPMPVTNVSPYYKDLEFAKNSNWQAMLSAYHA